MDQKENRHRALYAIAVVALILGYLFALNGRYSFAPTNAIVIDKWKRTYLKPGDNGKFVPLVSLGYNEHNINK